MLTPDTRVLLTDALRPPESYRVDVAVGTTYTLDLTALLLVPLTFAALDTDARNDDDSLAVAEIALLEALERYAEVTTVFCQAGAISVPAAYRSVMALAADSVYEVTPANHARISHPKVWALRFVDDDGAYLHRLIVLSRNLTFDRSWDTVLVLDESPNCPDSRVLDPQPLQAFLRALPGISTRAVSAERAEQIESLANTLTDARLVPPEPFDHATLLPLGVGNETWPFPSAVDRLVAISPFIEHGLLRRLPRSKDSAVLVSRAESFDRIGAENLAAWRTLTLSPNAERRSPDGESSERATSELDTVRSGLHAKTVVWDVGNRSTMVTGSANLTSAGWGGNIEFGVMLEGPLARCGTQAMLDGGRENTGLMSVLTTYFPESAEGEVGPAEASDRLIESFHRALAASSPTATVEVHDGETPSAAVVLDLAAPGSPRLPEGVASTVRPLTLPAEHHTQQWSGREHVWAPLTLPAVSPYFVIESVAGSGATRSRRRCIVVADLVGDVEQCRDAGIRQIFSSKDDVSRYLALLLTGDDGAAAPEIGALAWSESHPNSHTGDTESRDWPLFEPLVRAAIAESPLLDRVDRLITQLRRHDGENLVPEGFSELWSVIQEVRDDR